MNRSRLVLKSLCAFAFTAVFLSGCSKKSETNQQQATSPAQPGAQSSAPSAPQAASAPAAPGSLQPGQASGTYTAKGETVELKYAYASRGVRFGDQSIILLLTDKPIPPDSIAEEIKDQTMLLDGKLRGLEYVFSDAGYWVRYHPGQAQTSKSGQPKEYAVENEMIKGADEDDGEAFEGKYKRSVRFSAQIGKE